MAATTSLVEDHSFVRQLARCEGLYDFETCKFHVDTLLLVSAAGCQFGDWPTQRSPSGPPIYQAKPDSIQIDSFPYQRFFTQDKLGRQITFYLSKPTSIQAYKNLPLVVCIQGSGSQSVFLELDTEQGQRIVSTGPNAVVLKAFKDQVRVLVVEKPGLEFLVQPSMPGSSREGSEEFLREFP